MAKISFTFPRYFFIFSPWALYSPFTCLTTTWESLLISKFLTPISQAMFISGIIASYSALLIVVANWNCIATLHSSLLGPFAPLYFLVENPSMYTIHAFFGGPFSSLGMLLNSTIKLATAWPMSEVLGLNSMSNSLSSMAQLTNLP
jgi:hypothetical protein